MRMEKGIIILKKGELARMLFNFCRPSEYADRCQYNGKDNDFEKCAAFQMMSAAFPYYKERGDDYKKDFDSEYPGNFVLCPVIHIGLVQGEEEYNIKIEPASSE